MQPVKPPTLHNIDMSNIGQVIAVASGKGGVGKSTVAVNLAAALQAAGHAVGLLDADIYGPSVPRMTGVTGKPVIAENKKFDPPEVNGLKVMSMGFLVAEGAPVVWRGPMVQSALIQMLRDVNWGALDYLIIDLPPGTGDIQLTLSQQVKLTGAVIVSTPQDIALIDARKAVGMFQRVGVPILGIIENMSVHVCGKCGHAEHIFGHGGARAEAAALGVPLLAEIPLDINIRTHADEGRPLVWSAPESAAARVYRDLALALA